MSNSLEFIPHCDDEICSIGSAGYVCPICNFNITDYDLYMIEDKLHDGKPFDVICNRCGDKLKGVYNKDEYEFTIEGENG